MAVLPIEVRFETEPLQEGLEDVARIFSALAGKHGGVYRRLERDIDAIAERSAAYPPKIHHLGEGVFVVTPNVAWVQIIRRARALKIDFRLKGAR